MYDSIYAIIKLAGTVIRYSKHNFMGFLGIVILVYTILSVMYENKYISNDSIEILVIIFFNMLLVNPSK